MSIFEKIAKLQLNKDEYVVVAGSVLVALGMIDWGGDIDLCVSPKIYEKLKKSGWKEERWQNKLVLKCDIYDIGRAFGSWSLKDLQTDAIQIHGIYFMSLDKLLVWKKQLGRKKDLQHIRLIEKYMSNKS